MTILTKNTGKLRSEVAAHVAADSIIQGDYWDDESKCGCFIGCLAKGNDPASNEATYGLPVMLQRIAERIFEALPVNEAKAFFAALPDSVGCDGKDLSKVGWQFLSAELRSLPEQSAVIQAVIDPVITGIDLLASGQKWPAADAADAALAADVAADAAAHAALAAALAAAHAAHAAALAADVAAHAAAHAAWAAACSAEDTATAATAAGADWSAARLRQRSLLLRLIFEAPVVENYQ